MLLVESFQLRSLPLGVLLTRDPQTNTLDAADARDAPWLIRDFAFSVLPTAFSLTALRTARAHYPQPLQVLLGVGDPDLHEACSRKQQLDPFMPQTSSSPDRIAISTLCNLPGVERELDKVAAAIAPSPKSRVMLENKDRPYQSFSRRIQSASKSSILLRMRCPQSSILWMQATFVIRLSC
jgi:CHAT domain-containing protein